jgi:hypothetical protein
MIRKHKIWLTLTSIPPNKARRKPGVLTYRMKRDSEKKEKEKMPI